jgi:hypothetical protein
MTNWHKRRSAAILSPVPTGMTSALKEGKRETKESPMFDSAITEIQIIVSAVWFVFIGVAIGEIGRILTSRPQSERISISVAAIAGSEAGWLFSLLLPAGSYYRFMISFALAAYFALLTIIVFLTVLPKHAEVPKD